MILLDAPALQLQPGKTEANASEYHASQYQALTEIEAIGLQSEHDLANGHASHELSSSQKSIIDKMPQLWLQASGLKSWQAEAAFRDAFLRLAQTQALVDYRHFKICPTASNSIDTVATFLAANSMKTALIEPTFDNLYLILKRRGVELLSLPEETLHGDNEDHEALEELYDLLASVDAVFLVNPNNPSGRSLSEKQFRAIARYCAAEKKTLVLDNTFRFFLPQSYDCYQILLDSKVSFLSIEDTGKVWPTQEIKASLLICSQENFKQIEKIYDEIFLCHSNFALLFLAEFLNDAHERGLEEAVWRKVSQRRQRFREIISGTELLKIDEHSISSNLSVEWVKIQSAFVDDCQLLEFFKASNLVILPGRQFYWSKSAPEGFDKKIRFALLKSEAEFQSAMSLLSSELGRLPE